MLPCENFILFHAWRIALLMCLLAFKVNELCIFIVDQSFLILCCNKFDLKNLFTWWKDHSVVLVTTIQINLKLSSMVSKAIDETTLSWETVWKKMLHFNMPFLAPELVTEHQVTNYVYDRIIQHCSAGSKAGSFPVFSGHHSRSQI